MRIPELLLVFLVVYVVVDIPFIVVGMLRGYGTAKRLAVWLSAAVLAFFLWLYLAATGSPMLGMMS